MSIDDVEIEKIRKRDPEVFEKIYKENKLATYNYLLIKTKGDVDIANDILSETFCSLMETADKIKNLNNLKSYILQIANRRLCDYLRKKYIKEKYGKYFNDNDRIDDSIIDEMETREQLTVVNLAMNNLKPLFKNVLELKYIDEKSQNEIAVTLNKSVSAIETLLFRARKELRNEMQKLKGFIDEI